MPPKESTDYTEALLTKRADPPNLSASFPGQFGSNCSSANCIPGWIQYPSSRNENRQPYLHLLDQHDKFSQFNSTQGFKSVLLYNFTTISHTACQTQSGRSDQWQPLEHLYFFFTSALDISCFLTLCDIYRLTLEKSKCRGCCLLRNHCSALQHRTELWKQYNSPLRFPAVRCCLRLTGMLWVPGSPCSHNNSDIQV